ncbi:serum amyloid P-component [Amia ocellicauda]|uniref:serum amyloid P-component n=1 Tax=Amia ocellicauda TaxID=2972642 RepID=UPI0034638F84
MCWDQFLNANMKTAVLVVALLFGQLGLCEDLSGKVFIFPEYSDTAHVKLFPYKEAPLYAFTACLRFISDRPLGALFSIATREMHNGILLLKERSGFYQVYIQNQMVDFVAVEKRPPEWNHVCATWESGTGLVQLWVNGVGSVFQGLNRGGSVGPLPSIVLGQDQDNYGGGFQIHQSFQGQISDVHLWDHVLPPCEIFDVSRGSTSTQGNVLNWRAMRYSMAGYVILRQEPNLRPDCSCTREEQWTRGAEVNAIETSQSGVSNSSTVNGPSVF